PVLRLLQRDEDDIDFFFFFQAEDGIRDGHVTGVQTCALPIYLFPIKHGYRFQQPRFVFQARVGECWRYSCYEVTDDADRCRFYPPRFNPVLKFTIRTVMWKVHKQQLGAHLFWPLIQATLRADNARWV